jgi:hypothetical protein
VIEQPRGDRVLSVQVHAEVDRGATGHRNPRERQIEFLHQTENATPTEVDARADVSVVYVTHRAEPHFHWFADSLAAQVGRDRPQVVAVDGLYSPARASAFAQTVAGRFEFRHVAAKPTPWNGPQRLTRRDYSAIASARNTGIVHATGSYLMFVDDSCVLAPGWWERVTRAVRHRIVVAGAYRTEPAGPDPALHRDSRWHLGDDAGVVQVDGGQLFGCCFGAPRALLLEVNGCDELCDPAGGEDYHLGLRMAMTGAQVFFDRRMLVIKHASRHEEPAPLRLDKRIDPISYMERLSAFGVKRRSTDGGWDASHMVLDILYGTRRPDSIGNYYRLGELQEDDLVELGERFPREYWFDGQPLGEI